MKLCWDDCMCIKTLFCGDLKARVINAFLWVTEVAVGLGCVSMYVSLYLNMCPISATLGLGHTGSLVAMTVLVARSVSHMTAHQKE